MSPVPYLCAHFGAFQWLGSTLLLKFPLFLFTFISMLSLANTPSAAFLFIDTLLVSQPCSSPSLGGFNAQRGGKIWV